MRWLTAGIIMLLLGYTPVHAQAPEYQIKAAMLANFALFIDWPPAAFVTAESPFVVCVLGSDPFGPWLQHELGEVVGTHPVEIHQLQTAESAQECHIVFISRSEEPRLQQVMTDLPEANALIVSDVSDASGFCRQGGMVALVMDGNKVRFDLNAGGAEKARFSISSRLKQVARSVTCGGEG